MASACWKLDNNMNNYIDDSLILFLTSTLAKLVLESRIAQLFEKEKEEETFKSEKFVMAQRILYQNCYQRYARIPFFI